MGAQDQQFNYTHRVPSQLTYTGFSQSASMQIDRLNGIRSIVLKARGTFNVATNAATPLTLQNFVNDIRLTVGGGTVLWAGDMNSLLALNSFSTGLTQQGNFSNGVTGTGNGLVWQATGLMDFETTLGRVPIDTVLISRLFSTIELRATIGTYADLATGVVAANVTFGTFAITVSLMELINVKDGYGAVAKKVQFADYQITATQTEFTVPLATGNIVRNIYLRMLVDGALSDAVINNVKVLIGGDPIYDMPAAEIKAIQKQRNQMVSDMTGWYHIPFNPDRILTDGANFSKIGALSARLVCDVTLSGTTDILRVITEEALPVVR